jgi:transposase
MFPCKIRYGAGTTPAKGPSGDRWIAQQELPASAAHSFCTRLNELLAAEKFGEFAEAACQQFYARKMGRPRFTPFIYLRALLAGCFEGIGSEGGIAWRATESLGVRHLPGIGRDVRSPDHSIVSRTRRLMAVETQKQVFGVVPRVVISLWPRKGPGTAEGQDHRRGRHHLRSQRGDAEPCWPGHRRQLPGDSDRISPQGRARESGVETPAREQLAQLGRRRTKRASDADGEHPHEPEARIAKRKDGFTQKAHRAAHAVDWETGAIVAVMQQGADQGDTTTMMETVAEASGWIAETAAAVNNEADGERVSAEGPQEVVADQGYPSNAVVRKLDESGIRWAGKAAEQKAVYGNRRRVRGAQGKRLMRRLGEYIERSFAHRYETGVGDGGDAADTLTRAGEHPEADSDSRQCVPFESGHGGSV